MERSEVRSTLNTIRTQAIALGREVERGIPGLSVQQRTRLLAAIERLQRETERGESITGSPLRPQDVL